MTKVNVKARPGAKQDKVEKIDNDNFIISVKESPTEGRANRAIIKILSEYLNISPVRIKIVSGHTARNKILSIT